jgi:hypothetical protein
MIAEAHPPPQLTLEQGASLAGYREACRQAWDDLLDGASFLHPDSGAATERFFAAVQPGGAIAQARAAVVEAFGGAGACPSWVVRLLDRISADDGLPAPQAETEASRVA